MKYTLADGVLRASLHTLLGIACCCKEGDKDPCPKCYNPNFLHDLRKKEKIDLIIATDSFPLNNGWNRFSDTLLGGLPQEIYDLLQDGHWSLQWRMYPSWDAAIKARSDAFLKWSEHAVQ